MKATSETCHTASLLEEKQVDMKRKAGEDGSRKDYGASSAVTRKKTLAHATLEGPSEHDVRCPCPYPF